MKKLSICIPVLNQHELAHATLDQLYKTINKDTEVIVIDNGSDEAFKDDRAIVVRFGEALGTYPIFPEGFKYASGDILAFFHSDLVVWEQGWADRVIKEFEQDDNLGMIGFVGSDEIDERGGRGMGSTSNFQGKSLGRWKGSNASDHFSMNKSDGFSLAVVVDGCSMIIRREAWSDIGFREGYPPHHFYDRLISCQLIENGWHIGVLGIECDHFSGQTTGEPKYHKLAEDWSRDNIPKAFWETEVGDSGFRWNWDKTIYKEGERQFLKEFRDYRHIIPIKL